ncbi:MAG: HAMP domain-containing histidine kinase [Thermoproteota archaeon]|nr:HAMP domain-containing histidine kinase [Thermoproteota archaeon]
MMHKEQLKDKCALCGKVLATGSGNAHNTQIIEETIQNTSCKFDTSECALMFKRFIDVYGKDFQPLLGDKQYISDPFWDRVLPKEDEIKVIRAQEKDNIDTERSNVRDKRSRVVTIIRDSFEVQKLLKELVQSAKENVSLAIPTTATDLFFSSRQPQEVSSSPSDYSSSFSCSVFFQQIKNVAADNKNLTVKILTYPDRWPRESEEEEEEDSNTSSSVREDWEGKKPSNIQVKYMERDYSSLNEDIVILVVDRRASLAIELDEKEKRQKGSEEAGLRENHRKDALYRMIKLATYSENKSTVLSYISIFESLWKEIELNEKITSLLAEIKRRENIERDFINMAAHELRAPIQPVLGLAQILQTKKNVDSKEQEELLSVIIRNARRLNILTENLLDLAKIESNTLNLQKETFSLTELIFEAIADMKSQLSTNEVMVNVEYNDGSAARHRDNHKNDDKLTSKVLNPDDNSPQVLVEADKIRIMQVISNLLTNAIKFTRGGKVAIIIDNNNGTGKEKGEGDVVVSFRDNGTGIDPEIIDKVFEKFVTKSDKGTGLGLFISRKIIEAHGGSIWAKNNTNAEGATIAFSLPIAVSS